jgi:hypothetical protein
LIPTVDAYPANRAIVAWCTLQPFIAYTTKDAWTTLDTESTFDWVSDQWSVPINFTIDQAGKIRRSACEHSGRRPLLGR